MTVTVYSAECRGSRKSGVSVAWCGVVWCGVQGYYLQSYTVCRCHYSSHLASHGALCEARQDHSRLLVGHGQDRRLCGQDDQRNQVHSRLLFTEYRGKLTANTLPTSGHHCTGSLSHLQIGLHSQHYLNLLLKSIQGLTQIIFLSNKSEL